MIKLSQGYSLENRFRQNKNNLIIRFYISIISDNNCCSLDINHRGIQNNINNRMIKIDLEHNLSSLRIPELRVDPHSTILALKENIQKRYGSEPPYIRLTLKTKKGEVVTQLDEELRTLDFYGVQTGMIIQVNDLNPNSILKEIESNTQVEKYVMSEETYNLLPETFRKWKHAFLLENPQVKQSLSGHPQICDPQYLHSLANTFNVGMRCQLQNGARGEVSYIGQVPELGFGYFIGIRLDEAQQGLGDGTLSGNHYFFCDVGRGYFERPNKIEAGDFPQIEESDEI